MNNNPGAIGILPLYCIIILAIGLMNHVLVIPPLLQETKRDAWLTVLGSIPLYLMWVTLIFYIMKNTNQEPFIPWLQEHYGKVISWGVRVFFILYLALISVMTLKETTVWSHVSYLPRTPQLALSVSLIILCLFAASYGIRTLAITSGVLLPFVIIFGDFVMTANLPEKDYSLLTPLLENGMAPLLKGGIYIGGGLVELVIILLLQHQLKTRIRLWSIYILALFLVILVLGPVTGALAEFGPFEAAKLRYPAFEEWRLVSIGKYIRHLDFLSIYQWLSGALIRISISLYLLVELLALPNKKARTLTFLFIGILLVIAVELPVSDMQYLIFLKSLYFPISLVLVLLLSIVFSLLVLFVKVKGVNKNEI